MRILIGKELERQWFLKLREKEMKSKTFQSSLDQGLELISLAIDLAVLDFVEVLGLTLISSFLLPLSSPLFAISIGPEE